MVHLLDGPAFGGGEDTSGSTSGCIAGKVPRSADCFGRWHLDLVEHRAEMMPLCSGGVVVWWTSGRHSIMSDKVECKASTTMGTQGVLEPF